MSRFKKKTDPLVEADEWDEFVWFWSSLADHGLGPFARVFDRGPEPCPKCQDFCEGGGGDDEYDGLCFHCWNAVAFVEPPCPLCSGQITLKDLPVTLVVLK